MKLTRLILTVVAVSLGLGTSLGATGEEPVGLTASVLAGGTTLKDLDNESHVQLGIGYRFNSPWGIEAVYSSLDSESDDVPPIGAEVTRFHVDALYHLSDFGDLTPYFAIGVGDGAVNFDGGFDNNDRLVNLGVGAKYPLAENLFLRADLRFYSIVSGIDDLESTVGIGLHYVFAEPGGSAPAAPRPAPRARDGDNDGVPDSRDRCLRTPRGASVDSTGCSDADGDGVVDGDDRCPNTRRGVSVDNLGCPADADGDGVPNSADRCPDTTNRRAEVDARGCYVTLSETVRVDLAVQFDRNSAEARPEHVAEVRKVFEFMEKYPQTRVTIEGHTDSRGSAEYNRNLSQQRADTIANILKNRFGVSASRVSAVGYGESRPIDTNDTAEGRQRNRRVVGVVETSVETIRER